MRDLESKFMLGEYDPLINDPPLPTKFTPNKRSREVNSCSESRSNKRSKKGKSQAQRKPAHARTKETPPGTVSLVGKYVYSTNWKAWFAKDRCLLVLSFSCI